MKDENGKRSTDNNWKEEQGYKNGDLKSKHEKNKK